MGYTIVLKLFLKIVVKSKKLEKGGNGFYNCAKIVFKNCCEIQWYPRKEISDNRKKVSRTNIGSMKQLSRSTSQGSNHQLTEIYKFLLLSKDISTKHRNNNRVLKTIPKIQVCSENM